MNTNITTITKQPAPEYPCFKQYKGELKRWNFIVLFTAPLTGTVVAINSECRHPLGMTSHTWVESEFKVWHGTIEVVED